MYVCMYVCMLYYMKNKLLCNDWFQIYLHSPEPEALVRLYLPFFEAMETQCWSAMVWWSHFRWATTQVLGVCRWPRVLWFHLWLMGRWGIGPCQFSRHQPLLATPNMWTRHFQISTWTLFCQRIPLHLSQLHRLHHCRAWHHRVVP